MDRSSRETTLISLACVSLCVCEGGWGSRERGEEGGFISVFRVRNCPHSPISLNL